MKKKPEAVAQFQAAMPATLTACAQAASQARLPTLKVFAQDESRFGLLPIVRHRITACGVQPVTTVTYRFDTFYLLGAVDPLTGDDFFLQLPYLNTQSFQLWLEAFAQAFPDSFNILVLDNGTFHKAKALRWPPNVRGVFLPPYSPELNPIERLWRDLKDKLSDRLVKTLEELSDTVCRLITEYSKATLQSLTGYPYFIQAARTAQQVFNG